MIRIFATKLRAGKTYDEINSEDFKLRELISEKPFEDLIDLTDSKECQIDQLTKMTESCYKYLLIIRDKVEVGCKLQKFVETKLR